MVYKTKHNLPLPSSLTSPSTTPSLIPPSYFSHAVFALAIYSASDTLHTGAGKICSLASLKPLLNVKFSAKPAVGKTLLSSRVRLLFHRGELGCQVRDYSAQSSCLFPSLGVTRWAYTQWNLGGCDTVCSRPFPSLSAHAFHPVWWMW